MTYSVTISVLITSDLEDGGNVLLLLLPHEMLKILDKEFSGGFIQLLGQ